MRLVLHGDLRMAVQSVDVDSTASQRVPEFPKGLLLRQCIVCAAHLCHISVSGIRRAQVRGWMWSLAGAGRRKCVFISDSELAAEE